MKKYKFKGVFDPNRFERDWKKDGGHYRIVVFDFGSRLYMIQLHVDKRLGNVCEPLTGCHSYDIIDICFTTKPKSGIKRMKRLLSEVFAAVNNPQQRLVKVSSSRDHILNDVSVFDKIRINSVVSVCETVGFVQEAEVTVWGDFVPSEQKLQYIFIDESARFSKRDWDSIMKRFKEIKEKERLDKKRALVMKNYPHVTFVHVSNMSEGVMDRLLENAKKADFITGMPIHFPTSHDCSEWIKPQGMEPAKIELPEKDKQTIAKAALMGFDRATDAYFKAKKHHNPIKDQFAMERANLTREMR